MSRNGSQGLDILHFFGGPFLQERSSAEAKSFDYIAEGPGDVLYTIQ